MDSLKYVLSEAICKAVSDVAPAYGVTDLEGFATDLLVYMGIQERTAGAALPMTPEKKVVAIVPDPPKKAKKEETETAEKEDNVSVEKKGRSRTISKKMKESFVALGGTEEQLKELTKRYKDATDADIESVGGSFEGFARNFLGLTVEKKKSSKKTKSRITWTPTPKKMFKEIVEGSGGAYTDDLKETFTEYLNDMDEETFKTVSIEGHMRAFAVDRFAPPSPVLQRQNATYDSAEPRAASAVFGVEESKSAEEDEELEEFTHEEETLLIGVSSGKIYRSTEEAGDVLIGVAGKGRFADVRRG